MDVGCFSQFGSKKQQGALSKSLNCGVWCWLCRVVTGFPEIESILIYRAANSSSFAGSKVQRPKLFQQLDRCDKK